MKLLGFIKKFRRNNRGSVPAAPSDAVRLMEIELLVKTRPPNPYEKALEDLYEIHMRQIKHYEDRIDGYHKER